MRFFENQFDAAEEAHHQGEVCWIIWPGLTALRRDIKDAGMLSPVAVESLRGRAGPRLLRRTAHFPLMTTTLTSLISLLVSSTNANAQAPGQTLGIIHKDGRITASQQQICGTFTPSSSAPLAVVPGSFPLPIWANQRALLLNGWRLEYTGSDNEIKDVQVEIVEASVDEIEDVLAFKVRARLTDDSDSDAFGFCAQVLFVAWNDNHVHVAGDMSDGLNNRSLVEHSILLRTRILNSALDVFFSRGFKANYVNPVEDHHLGWMLFDVRYTSDYHMFRMTDDSDHYARSLDVATRLTPADSEEPQLVVLHIEAQVLQAQSSGEVVVPYSTQPTSMVLFPICDNATLPSVERQLRVSNLSSFEVVLPVLSGWSLSYECYADHHVKRMGASIDGVDFDPVAGDLKFRIATTLFDDTPTRPHVGVIHPRLLAFAGDPVPGCNGNPTTYTDQGFSPSLWTSAFNTGMSWGTPGTYQVTVQDPAGLQFSNTSMQLGGIAGMFIEHFNTYAIYDPATDGEIGTIAASFAVRWSEPPPITPNREAVGAFVIRQGGSIYWAGRVRAASDAGWVQSPVFTRDSFMRVDGNGPLLPDFSTQGLPLEFGFLSGGSGNDPNVPSFERHVGIDHWTVTICPVL